MKLGIDAEKKVAVIQFSWREIWTIIKNKRLNFDLKSVECLANMVVRLHIEFDEFLKKNEQKKLKKLKSSKQKN